MLAKQRLTLARHLLDSLVEQMPHGE